MKFICNRCGKTCTFESDFLPTKCIKNGRITYAWKEVPETYKVVTENLQVVGINLNKYIPLTITVKGN